MLTLNLSLDFKNYFCRKIISDIVTQNILYINRNVSGDISVIASVAICVTLFYIFSDDGYLSSLQTKQ